MLDTWRPPSFSSLVDLLRHRAVEQPDDRAYIFLSDQGSEEAALSFAELDRQAAAVAARLLQDGQVGDRALLLFGPGLAFITAYFGCLSAGIIPVPMMLPRRNSSLDSSAPIIADCSPRFAITNSRLSSARPDVIERLQQGSSKPGRLPGPGREEIAFLQYTSGQDREAGPVWTSLARADRSR